MRQIGPYQILELLGKGGMGEVYLAEDLRLGRKLALKLLPPELTSNESLVLRFQQEARTASALNHPNILTIFDIGEIESSHFIATEFVKGETLRHRMAASAMSLQEIFDITIQVASALGAAHEAGVVHRDVKPENIMVRLDGIVKVLDFGIAKLTQRVTSGSQSEMGLLPLINTEPGMVMGTPRYMSPEQVRGYEVDERSDIFSLGAVFYEMITGHVPFEGDTAGDIIASILQKEPRQVAELAEAAAGLQPILDKTLCKDLDARYQTMADLIADLRGQEQEPGVDRRSFLPLSSSQSRARGATTEVSPRANQLSQIKRASTAQAGVAGLTGKVRRHPRRAALLLGLLLATAAVVTYFSFSAPSSKAAINSVAVLPFLNAGDDPNMEYLSEGISESLINLLSGLPQLKVIARSSSFKYNPKEVDLQEAAKALNVQAIVTGRVMQHGDQLQVSVELVNTRDKTQLWGEQYNRKATDLQAVQEEIARLISEKLRVRLTGSEEKLLTKHATQNEQAYRLYLNGMYYDRKSGIENKKKALDYFNQAIAFDPEIAQAYANAAVVYNILAENCAIDPKVVVPQARAAAQRALDIDDTLAEGHAAMALIKNGEWDWSGAEREYKRAIELNPNLALAHSDYAMYLSNMGRQADALSENKRAQELDPLSIKFSNRQGLILQVARRYDEAMQQFQNIIRLQSDSADAYIYLAYTYADKGMYADAIAQYQKFISLSGENTSEQSYLGFSYAKAGKRNEALALLDKLNTTQECVSPAESAILYAGLGDKDGAFAALERAFAAHDSQMQYLKVEPHYDSLRPDPRFTDLMRRVGLTP
jgi:eukaryotic-like serine/threonine-protein kinase